MPEGTSEPCIPLGTLKLVPKSDSGEWKEMKINSSQGSVLMIETVQMNFMVNDSKIKRHSHGKSVLAPWHVVTCVCVCVLWGVGHQESERKKAPKEKIKSLII